MGKISVVINTLNEEENIERAINSVKWADEILVCDMHSEDRTVEITKRLGAKVIYHDKVGFVEPARNYAISKASCEWILILDADEEVPQKLAARLKELMDKPIVSDFVEIPRKNIIFGKWIEASMWWPDYNIRFFKKGTVKWSDKIHSKPQTSSLGLKLPAEENLAIVHYNYSSIDQYLNRLNRYSTIQAKELFSEGERFKWTDLISKPLSEFLSRYFANHGYEDGLHGLVLSLLQAFSFLVVFLKLWEMEKFKPVDISLTDNAESFKNAGKEIDYWLKNSSISHQPFKRLWQKAKNYF